jgi:hypothetical protein
MFGKVLVTILVLALVWMVVRNRVGGARTDPAAPRTALIPAAALRALAYGLVSVTVAGTGLYLYQGWEQGREIVRVRVVNAGTGQGVTYRARRQDIVGRSFRTLDGHAVTLADVERMEVDSGQ